MLESRKHVFWQALLVAVLIFAIGLVFGIYLEELRTDSSNVLFYQSDVSLYDSFALRNIISGSNFSCDAIMDSNIEFADRIYNEARTLEKYDSANKITDSVKIVHRKYDLLRTLLWINLIDLKKQCKNFNTVVYLYLYNNDEVGIKAEQVVFSRVLGDLKQQEGSNIILIPIAADNDISSLNYLISKYGIVEFPAIIINEKVVIYNQTSVQELKRYLAR